MADSYFLAVPDHAPTEIVADDYHNGQFFSNGIFEFHEVKTDRAVTGDEQHPLIRVSEFGRIGIGQSHRKGPENAVIQVVAGLSNGPGHAHPGGSVAAIGHDDIIFSVHEAVNFTGQAQGVDRCIVAFPVSCTGLFARCVGGFQAGNPGCKPAGQFRLQVVRH